MILSKNASLRLVRVSMILPKYASRHGQKLYDIVTVFLWVGPDFHVVAKVSLQTRPETI